MIRLQSKLRLLARAAAMTVLACFGAAHADPIGPLMPTTGGTLFKSYEIYHDAADPNIFYARRTQPVLASAQGGGYIFAMEKFEGETAQFGGSLTATVALENVSDDFQTSPQWAGKDIRSMPFVANSQDYTYLQIRDNSGNPDTLWLEPTTDAQNRISFHVPLTAQQAERIWQTRTGNTLPATLFLRRHIMAVSTDLQVSVTIDIHDVYNYFSASASVGFWVFKASYKQVRESHNIDNYIHVKTFQGLDVTDARLAQAQEEAWKRIKEYLFRETGTSNPAPSPPAGGWPASILAIANDFYNNYRLATGSGYLTAEVIDIRKQFDAHYQYDIDQKRQEAREVSIYYDLDISAIHNQPGYFFIVSHFPASRTVSVDTLAKLPQLGVNQVKVTLWQTNPSGQPVDTQGLRFDIGAASSPLTRTATFHPSQTQTLGYKYRVSVGLPDQVIQGPLIEDPVGSEDLTVPSRISDFFAHRVVDFLTGGKQLQVQRADLSVTYTHKSDGTPATLLIPAETRSLGGKVVPASIDVNLADCDDSVPIAYEFTAIGRQGQFYTAGAPSVQARAVVQLRPTQTTAPPARYSNLLQRLKATENPARRDALLSAPLQ